MKKFLSVCMICILLFGMVGCGNAENNGGVSKKPENNAANAGKTLVVYYSATGTTEKVAKSIAQIVAGDIFEIVPKQAYTAEDLDWTNDHSRVSTEHKNPGGRNVKLNAVQPDNFKNYDTVFIGYPIWWGIAAWPVDNFIKENDFTGKTVIPFCTAASSDIGESGKLLSDMAGTGEWMNGKRFYSNFSDDEIHGWIDSLNIN